MKRGWTLLLLAVLLLGCAALAEAPERDYAPEAGAGWLAVEIHGEAAELLYTGSAKGMTGVTHTFEGDGYTITLGFDKKLAAGEKMGENSITQIEVISHNDATAGYYFTKKASGIRVDSEVLMEKIDEDGIWQGAFRVVASPGDRWVGDLRPGIIAGLRLENAEFCFAQG